MYLCITKKEIVKEKTVLELVTFWKEQRLILFETSLGMCENINEKRFCELEREENHSNFSCWANLIQSNFMQMT